MLKSKDGLDPQVIHVSMVYNYSQKILLSTDELQLEHSLT